MDDLNANARALINAARSFDDPTDNDQDRVRTAVLMRVGSIAAVGTVAVTAAKASSAAASAGPLIASSLTSATLFGGVAAKIGAVVVLGAIASGAYVAFRAPQHPAASKPTVAAFVAPLAPAAPAPATEAAPVTPDPAVEAADLPVEDVKPSPARVTRRAADLEGEMKLLRQADGALRRGDSAAALVALNKHAAQYPSGVLAQEREGVRAIALCSSGNTSAGQSAAQRFLSAASKSPLASRIRSACSLKE